MQELARSLQQARGELKRLRTDLIKFKSEERYRMKSVEEVVKSKEITIEQVQNFKNLQFKPPVAKKAKIAEIDSEGVREKVHLSEQIAIPIGKIRSPFLTKSGTPRQPGLVDTVSTVELFPGETGKEVKQRWMPKDALEGLSEYSHCWIVFHFHLNDPGSNGRKSKVAPPRGEGKKVGIFASRAPYRPSPIGLTLAKIESIDLENGKVKAKWQHFSFNPFRRKFYSSFFIFYWLSFKI